MLNIFYYIFIYPLESGMNYVLKLSYSLTDNYGYSIIILSLIVNIVLVPLYLLAERWQNAERRIKKRMEGDLDKINKAFTGELKYYYTQAVYRMFNYHPLMALRVSFGFFIQVPFFFAAYHLLSHFTAFEGVSFLFLQDLAVPDMFVDIAGDKLNVMPVIMTVVNIISAYIYTKNLEAKDKAQLWGLAVVFLLLLYNSASGLVLYWTMNNVFSLIKNYIIIVFYEKERVFDFKPPRIDLRKTALSRSLYYVYLLFSAAALYMVFFHFKFLYAETRYTGFYLSVYLFFIVSVYSISFYYYRYKSFKKKKSLLKFTVNISLLLLSSAVIFLTIDNLFNLNILSALRIFRKIYLLLFLLLNGLTAPFIFRYHGEPLKIADNHKKLYFSAALYMLLVVFVFTPLKLYASAPGEIEVSLLKLVLSAFLAAAAGAAVFTGLYFVVPRKIKSSFIFIILIFSSLVFLYTYLYPGDFGNLNKFSLSKAYELNGEILRYILELSALSGIAVLIFHLIKSNRKLLFWGFAGLSLAAGFQTAVSLNSIKKTDYYVHETEAGTALPVYNEEVLGFSREGKNVAVILLDMFTGGYIPEIRSEIEGFDDIYSGFTWYPNTLTAGFNTSTSISVMHGGWDYHTDLLNKRNNDYFYKYIAESYEFVPEYLKDKNYSVSFMNPFYYYTPNGNLTRLKEKGIAAGYSMDYIHFWKNKHGINIENSLDKDKSLSYRLLLAVSVFKASPFLFKPFIYNNGEWILIGSENIKNSTYDFALSSWAFLDSMADVSSIKNNEGNTFKFFHDYSTHEPYSINKEGKLSREYPDPDYPDHKGGKSSYYSAKAAMQTLGRWIDWLKEEGIYDNTKIILISDHGNNLTENPMKPENFKLDFMKKYDFTRSQPLLMVKDFNSNEGFKTDSRFMSNGDLNSIAFSHIKKDNPFRKDPTTGEGEKDRTLTFIKSDAWRWESLLNKKRIGYEWVYEVKNSIFDPENWKKAE